MIKMNLNELELQDLVENKEEVFDFWETAFEVSQILDLSKCPNCEEDMFNAVCKSCWYGLWDSYYESKLLDSIEKEIFKKSSNKLWIWKKHLIWKFDWKEVFYYDFPNRIKENKAELKISFWWKKYFLNVSYDILDERDVSGRTRVKYVANLQLINPDNYDWKHKILNYKKQWTYFDFNLALQIAREILSKIEFNRHFNLEK